MKLHSEGAEIHIEWHLLKPGTSFFIPAIQTEPLIKSVKKAASLRNMNLHARVCYDKGFYGVRFWRFN